MLPVAASWQTATHRLPLVNSVVSKSWQTDINFPYFCCSLLLNYVVRNPTMSLGQPSHPDGVCHNSLLGVPPEALPRGRGKIMVPPLPWPSIRWKVGSDPQLSCRQIKINQAKTETTTTTTITTQTMKEMETRCLINPKPSLHSPDENH